METTDRAAWLASLKTGDRVMIAWVSSTGIPRAKTGNLRWGGSRWHVGNYSFDKDTGESEGGGVRIIPVDKELAKAERIRNKCIKQIEAAEWWSLPTETLAAIAALLPTQTGAME